VNHPDPIILREIPVIQKIIQDETWLEGERRGCFVVSWDPIVQEHVCQVVLRVGMELRRSVTAQAALTACPADPRAQDSLYGRAA
jgi:hypothetical protein